MEDKQWFMITFAVLAVITIVMTFVQAFKTIPSAPTVTTNSSNTSTEEGTTQTAVVSQSSASGSGAGDSISVVMAVVAVILLGVASYFGFAGGLNTTWTTVILVAGCLVEAIMLLRARDVNALLSETQHGEFNATILLMMLQICFGVMAVRG